MIKRTFNKNALLKVSLIANAVFIVLAIITGVSAMMLSTADLRIAEYNALQAELCGEKYQSYLQKWEESNGEDGKKVFAATVCLRDYRTGNDLDLESLITP